MLPEKPAQLRTLFTAEIVEVANGALLTVEAPFTPSPDDPLAQRNGFKVGPTFYKTLDAAIGAIKPTAKREIDALLVRQARKALNV